MIIDEALSESLWQHLYLLKNIFLKVKMIIFNFCPSITFGNIMSV